MCSAWDGVIVAPFSGHHYRLSEDKDEIGGESDPLTLDRNVRSFDKLGQSHVEVQMSHQANRFSLISYVEAFFPSNFEVMLERSESNPDDRILTVCDVMTSKTTTYEGPLLAILDICSMGTIAADLCNELCGNAATRREEISK